MNIITQFPASALKLWGFSLVLLHFSHRGQCTSPWLVWFWWLWWPIVSLRVFLMIRLFNFPNACLDPPSGNACLQSQSNCFLAANVLRVLWASNQISSLFKAYTLHGAEGAWICVFMRKMACVSRVLTPYYPIEMQIKCKQSPFTSTNTMLPMHSPLVASAVRLQD